jgi:hypothetical protein
MIVRAGPDDRAGRGDADPSPRVPAGSPNDTASQNDLRPNPPLTTGLYRPLRRDAA